LFVELDIVGVGIEVLVDEVVADPLDVEEKAPDPARAGDSKAVAADGVVWRLPTASVPK
jgi:hypothetical protein